jgi:predicted SnoaL-like aldol condensation-catalyzing enzyme
LKDQLPDDGSLLMATGTAVMATSLDGFHATATGQRADELVRALFDAVNGDDHARIDALAARSFLSYDMHGTRSRTGFNAFQQILGVEESPGGLFPERRGTAFGWPESRPITREESRAVVRRLYDSVISTGREDDVDVVGESYIQNSGWTPDGRAAFASAIAISRGAMPDGRALQTHIVAENNRLASRSVWDGTITVSGRAADFTTLDFFRIDDGLIAEHWESVDWVRGYQSFGLLPDDVRDA